MSSAATPPPARRRRWLWLCLGGLALGGCAMLALLATPPVQAWLVRHAVALQPGWRVDFQHFGASPSRIEVDGLDFAMPGINARSAPIAIHLAPGRIFNKRELKLERIEARKLRVTLTPAEFAASSSREPFNGLLALLQLPFAWALDAAQLDGEVVVRDAGQSVLVGTFSLDGGGLSAEQAGEFTYELALNSSLLPIGPENQVRSRGKVRLTQGSGHRLSAVTVEGDLQLPRYGGLALPPARFILRATNAEKRETYHARLDFDAHATLEFNGTLDAALARLTGRATLEARPSLLSTLVRRTLPSALVSGHADVSLDLRRNDLDVTLAGNLQAQEWASLDPRLSVIPSLHGKLAGAFSRRGGKLSLTQFEVTARPENTAAELRLTLTRPLDPTALPGAPLATLTLDRLPLAWANPWLAASGLVLDPVELHAAWHLGLTPDRRTLTLDPARPVSIADVALKGPKLPPLPLLSLSVSPRATLSSARASLAFDDFVVTTPQSDNLALRLSASYEFGPALLHSHGELNGAIPTLLSGAEQPLPFTFHARWDAACERTELRVKTLEFATRRDSTTPCLALDLLQPLTLDLARLTVPRTAVNRDLARLSFAGLPLGWISRWIAPRELKGTLVAGDSVLRAAPDGKLTLETVAPWHLAAASFGIGGKAFFDGEATIAPTLTVHADRYTAELREISARHRDGSRIDGTITADVRLSDLKASTAIELFVDLPALPHSETTFGPLYATLRARSHTESSTIAMVDQLSFRLLSRDREVLLLDAPAPFVAGLSSSGFVSVATSAPLKLTTGEFPLSWLRPWLPALEADGLLQPGEFQLTADLTRFLLRPIKPVHVRNFSARFAGRDIARDVEFRFFPGLDLTLLCTPTPVFKLAHTGSAHLTNGAIDVAGQRAVDLDVSVGFIGDHAAFYPSSIDYTTRADFAQLSRVPALVGTGLPSRGTFVARANGDLLGRLPVEFWSRLEGIPSADGRRLLAPLELLAHGKVAPADQAISAEVQVFLDTHPRVTDAYFETRLNFGAGRLESASRLESHFFDAAEAFALVDAIQQSRTPAQTLAATPPPETSTALAAPSPATTPEPIWSQLRGQFDLDLGTVRYAPYQLDRVRGHLAVRDRELVLSDLQGEMFAGRWHGGARVDYQPENPSADHAVTGEFKIEQFDSARIVQTVFPTELASVDARIDVRSSIKSRGRAVIELIDRAEAGFTVEGRQGIVRLNVPKQEMASTAAVFGGAVLLSPELRALGRLLKKFAEMPVDQLLISGERRADGDVLLTEFRLDSPQARLSAHGRIPHVAGAPIMNRPLELSVDLAAKDEMAVILGGMSLIARQPRADGYRPLKEKFELRGKAGEPDTRPLYDLLAKAVLGSKGTWGFLMRKVQDEVKKPKASPPPPPRSASR